MKRSVGWLVAAALVVGACSAGNDGVSSGGGTTGGGTSGGGLFGSGGGVGASSEYEEYCKAKAGCEGGNEKDIAACIAGMQLADATPSPYGCDKEGDADSACHRAGASCDGFAWKSAPCPDESAAAEACVDAASCLKAKNCTPAGPAPAGDFGAYCFAWATCMKGNDADVAACVYLWELTAVTGEAYGCATEVENWKACLKKTADPCGLPCMNGLTAITQCQDAASGKKK